MLSTDLEKFIFKFSVNLSPTADSCTHLLRSSQTLSSSFQRPPSHLYLATSPKRSAQCRSYPVSSVSSYQLPLRRWIQQTLLGKALAYSINQEEYLRVFLSDSNVPMNNNYAEQAIRPFTIGRKNFVMIESSNGAKASAILYSLVETAKANRINTFEYFNLLLTEIPQHMDDKNLRFIDDLLPWSPWVQKECPSRYKKS